MWNIEERLHLLAPIEIDAFSIEAAKTAEPSEIKADDKNLNLQNRNEYQAPTENQFRFA